MFDQNNQLIIDGEAVRTYLTELNDKYSTLLNIVNSIVLGSGEVTVDLES